MLTIFAVHRNHLSLDFIEKEEKKQFCYLNQNVLKVTTTESLKIIQRHHSSGSFDSEILKIFSRIKSKIRLAEKLKRSFNN